MPSTNIVTKFVAVSILTASGVSIKDFNTTKNSIAINLNHIIKP